MIRLVSVHGVTAVNGGSQPNPDWALRPAAVDVATDVLALASANGGHRVIDRTTSRRAQFEFLPEGPSV